MSRSANAGRDDAFGTGLSDSTQYTPTGSRFLATAGPFARSTRRSASSHTNNIPVALTGQVQPRFNLVVIHGDDWELGALGDSSGGDSSPRVGEPYPVLSRVTARPWRLAAFSSCGCES
jgi:hypothetical protein